MTKKGLFGKGFSIPKKGNKYKKFILNKIIQK